MSSVKKKWPRIAACGNARTTVALLVMIALMPSMTAHAGVQLAGFTVEPTPSPPPAVHAGLLPVSTKKALVIPAGSELCGIDSIFADGFESLTFTPTVQLSGGIASPGLAQDIVGSGTVSVTVTPLAATGNPTVDVTGTFVGPENTGITVNGIFGYTVNGQFLVPNVPLNAGSNILSVNAMTLPGTTATSSTSVTQSGSGSPISMQSDYPAGYAPFVIRFNFKTATLPGNATVQSVAINFKGTGVDDFTGSSLSGAPSTYVYTQPGMYTARFRVTDSNSVTYTAYRSVLIQNLAARRGMVCDVFGYLRDRLANQDATNAGYAFHADMRSNYLSLFNQLLGNPAGSNLPALAQQLGVVVNGQLGFNFADMLIVRDNADQTRSGFPLRVTVGADGVWRISEM